MIVEKLRLRLRLSDGRTKSTVPMIVSQGGLASLRTHHLHHHLQVRLHLEGRLHHQGVVEVLFLTHQPIPLVTLGETVVIMQKSRLRLSDRRPKSAILTTASQVEPNGPRTHHLPVRLHLQVLLHRLSVVEGLFLVH